MVIYHLGFPLNTYLAACVNPNFRGLDCSPLDDTIKSVLHRIGDDHEFFFHIDLSVQNNIPLIRPELIKAMRARKLTIHNAHFDDQRKRNLQRVSKRLGFESLSAARKGNSDELLMVKSDLNVAGGPEYRTLKRIPGLPVPQLPTRILDPFQYFVARRGEIGASIWSDPTIHVEKYIHNDRGNVIRSFWNQGKAVVSRIENPHEVVKKRNARCPRWNYSEPVDDLTEIVFNRMRRYAEHLKLSFFAADWAVGQDEEPFIVDLNLTPQWMVNPASQTNNRTPDFPMTEIPSRLKHD